MSRISLFTLWVLVLATVSPGAAFAYIGPGAGLSAIVIVIALAGAVILAIIGFVWYPLKRLLRKKPANPDNKTRAEEDSQK